MITTAIDSNILIDILFNDHEFAADSAAALTSSSMQGAVVISSVVIAEVAGYFPQAEAAQKFFSEIDAVITSLDAKGAISAGQIWRQRLQKDRTRILPDYIVAAHAVEFADRLLTRDAGFTRMNVPGLVVVSPDSLLA